MVNENIKLIIENKKPIEIVQEVNNEIPSFEEFMRTYENDGNVNYADLNGSDVGEVKGYGPCGNYPVCRKSTNWVDFRMGCLACSNSSPSYWCHARDGCRSSRVEISNKAHIRCKNCYTDNHMANWTFSCSKHWGEYRSINRDSYNKCMAIALNQANTSNQVVTDLSTYIALHPSEFGWN